MINHLQKLFLLGAAIISIMSFTLAVPRSGAQDMPEPVLRSDFNGRVRFIVGEKEGGYHLYAPAQGVKFQKGLSSKTIFFSGKQDFKLYFPNWLNPEQGSVIFWVKPLYDRSDGKSHLFLKQATKRLGGAFNIWDVWNKAWGGHSFYFEYDKVSLPFRGINFLRTDEWNHVAVSWKSCPNGYARSFLNGELIRHAPLKNKVFHSAKGKLYIGGRSGGCRAAESLIDRLIIYDRALSAENIEAIYKTDLRDWKVHQRKWTDSSNNLEYSIRDSSGRLIEVRALFDAEPFFLQDLEGVLNKLQRGNFNVYIPCVWYGAKARWRSEKESIQKDYYLRSAIVGEDLLEALIDRAHAAGIQVHPWFCVVRRQGDAHPEFTEKGTPRGQYDIHLPGFDDFITGLVKEVVEKYNVDGINLDYIRSCNVCKGSLCKEKYRQATGRNLLLDSKYGKEHAEYLKWQAETMNKIVEKISSVVRATRPDIIISVDSAPVPPGKLNNQGRNHKVWLEKGWIDLVFYMNYGIRLMIDEINIDQSMLPTPNNAFTIISNYSWTENNKYKPMDALKFIRQVNYCRNQWPGVIGVYLYERLNESQINALVVGPFHEKALADWNMIFQRSKKVSIGFPQNIRLSR
jgi:uncharacterized lipoprotein YddW (UPF0748 family)